jgi:hypothetical protein
MLLTKHLLFVGFSLQDPNFSEVAGTVRRARAASGVDASVAGIVPNGDGGDASSGDASSGGASGDDNASSGGASGGGASGTLLTLHNRPFLAELWPELSCVPMDRMDTFEANRVPRPQCARRMEMVLDMVSLEASTTTRHLLDADFSGAFSPADDALKSKLQDFRGRLAANPTARQSSGFAVVDGMLRRLGDIRQYNDDEDADQKKIC